MFGRKRSPSTDALICSFCHKSEDKVGKLISSPSDYPRAYICDECIAVCNSILADERKGPESFYVDAPFAQAVCRWLAGPPDDPAAVAELRRNAEAVFGQRSTDDSLAEEPGVA